MSSLADSTDMASRAAGQAMAERTVLASRLVLAIVGVAFFLIVLIGMFRELNDRWRHGAKVDGSSPRFQSAR